MKRSDFKDDFKAVSVFDAPTLQKADFARRPSLKELPDVALSVFTSPGLKMPLSVNLWRPLLDQNGRQKSNIINGELIYDQ